MALNVAFFSFISLFDQMDIIHRHGEYMTTIKENKNIISLYLLDDVFVEVYYHEKYPQVRFVEFLSMNELRMELYLEEVNLTDIYKAKTN